MSSTFDYANGRMAVELQIGRLSKDATQKIQRILAEDRPQAAQQQHPPPLSAGPCHRIAG